MELPVAKKGQDLDIEIAASDIAQVLGRTSMDYGDSGDGKSTRAHSLARYYFQKSGGKKVRLVAAEDSSKNVFADLIEAGIVEAVFMTDSGSPLIAMERITEGWWPLVGEYELYDKDEKIDGKIVKTQKRRQKWQSKEDWEGSVSAYIFEGLTTTCEIIKDYLTATNRFPREQSDGFTEGGRTFMAASQTAYGFTQVEGIKLIKTAGMLPVERVHWSAHEAKGKDDFGKEAIRGPKLVGGAATDQVRKYVGILLHADRVKNEKGLEEIRVYVTNHPDSTNAAISWKAKVTIPPGKAQALIDLYPKGYFVPTLPNADYTNDDGLIPFFKALEKLEAEASTAASSLLNRVRQVKQVREFTDCGRYKGSPYEGQD